MTNTLEAHAISSTTYEVLQEAKQMLRWAVQAVVLGGILSDVSWPSPSLHDG